MDEVDACLELWYLLHSFSFTLGKVTEMEVLQLQAASNLFKFILEL